MKNGNPKGPKSNYTYYIFVRIQPWLVLDSLLKGIQNPPSIANLLTYLILNGVMTILRVGDCFPHNTEQPFNSLPFLIFLGNFNHCLHIMVLSDLRWSLGQTCFTSGCENVHSLRNLGGTKFWARPCPFVGQYRTPKQWWDLSNMSLSMSGSQYLNVNLLPLGAFLEIGDTPTNRFPFKNIKKTVFGLCLDHDLGSAVQEKHGLQMVLASCLTL